MIAPTPSEETLDTLKEIAFQLTRIADAVTQEDSDAMNLVEVIDTRMKALNMGVHELTKVLADIHETGLP